MQQPMQLPCSARSLGKVGKQLLFASFVAIALAGCGGGGGDGSSSSGGGTSTFGASNPPSCINNSNEVNMACFIVPDTGIMGQNPTIDFVNYNLDTATGNFTKGSSLSRKWHDIDVSGRSAKVDADNNITTTYTWDKETDTNPEISQRTPFATFTDILTMPLLPVLNTKVKVTNSAASPGAKGHMQVFKNASPITITVPGTSDKIKVKNSITRVQIVDNDPNGSHEGLVSIEYYSAGIGPVAKTQYVDCNVSGLGFVNDADHYNDVCGTSNGLSSQHSSMWLRTGSSNGGGTSQPGGPTTPGGGNHGAGCSAMPSGLTADQKSALQSACGSHTIIGTFVDHGSSFMKVQGTLTVSSDASGWSMKASVKGHTLTLSSSNCAAGSCAVIQKVAGNDLLKIDDPDSNSDKTINYSVLSVTVTFDDNSLVGFMGSKP